MRNFELRFSPEDQIPVTWTAIAEFLVDPETSHPVAEGGEQRWRVACALHPDRAIYKLAEDIVDGAECLNCGRPCGITDHFDPMPGGVPICWYQYDPELREIRRGCA